MKHLFIIFITVNLLFGTIINVPGDQPTIQAGINASVDGDTVLVQPGAYVENINFNGHNITVASRYILEPDTTLISTTIIDGNHDGSVVTFENGEDPSAVLTGFTLSNGVGQGIWGFGGGGGITCSDSDPTVSFCVVTDNIANNGNGGGIYCNGSNPTFLNLSILQNNATNGGGIYFHTSSPQLINCIIRDNNAYTSGGGICDEWYSSPVLQNVIIQDNYAEGEEASATNGGGGIYSTGEMSLSDVVISGNYGLHGGGILLMEASTILSDVQITNNSASSGGGMYLVLTSPTLINTTITCNTANTGGGMHMNWNCTPNFSAENRSSIFLNNASNRSSGADIFAENIEDPIAVVLDTFTVIPPNDYYASPIDFFEFDILNYAIDQYSVDADLYISPDGSDDNDGLTAEFPLRTIHYANTVILADSLHPHMIHLLTGIYSPDTNGEIFPIELRNYISLTGQSQESVILDADSTATVVSFIASDGSSLSGVTVTGGFSEFNPWDVNTDYFITGGGIYISNSNPVITNVTITENSAQYGGGIFCEHNSNPVISDVSVVNNSAIHSGGGIYIRHQSSPILIDTIIEGNYAGGGGGGISITYNYNFNISNPILYNVVLANNSAGHGGGIKCYVSDVELQNVVIVGNYTSGGGGGMWCTTEGEQTVTNSIFWDNTPNAIDGNASVQYSDIQGGWEGEGNIDADPLFDTEGENPYALTADSPCIDAGDPDSPLDPDGTIADIGAYYFHHILEDDPVHFNYVLGGYEDDYLNFADTTGYSVESHIIIETIDEADAGDEIGLLDYNGMINFGNCDEQYGEILVGAGVWQGVPLEITAYGSMDFCDNPDIEYGQYPGWVEGNPIYVLYWRASEDQVYLGDYDDESGVLSWAPLNQIIPLVIPSTPSSYDVNNDFSTDILDVVITIEFILGMTEFSEVQFVSVDTNSDGSVDILDIVTIIDYILNS